MNTLMIYDSRFGNTEQIARAIADVLKEHGPVQLVPATEADTPDLREVDLLVLGCPTQHHGLTPAMQTLFEHMPREALYGLASVTFDTRYRMVEFLSGSAAHLMAQRLKRAGARLLLPQKASSSMLARDLWRMENSSVHGSGPREFLSSMYKLDFVQCLVRIRMGARPYRSVRGDC